MAACPAGHESASTDFCDICGIRIDGAPPQPLQATAGIDLGKAGADQGQASAAPAGPGPSGAPAEPCPQCGSDRTGQFCEVCGYDFSASRNVTPAAEAAPSVSPASASPAGASPAGASAGSTTRPRPAPATPGQAERAAPPAQASAGPASAWTAVASADRPYFDSVIAAGGPDAPTIQFPDYCPERRFRLAGKEMRIGRYSASRGLEPEIDLTGPPADPGVSHLHAVLIAQPDGTWSVLDPGSSNGTQLNGREIMTGVPVPLRDGDRVCIGAWTVLTIQAD
jgi:FHA domain